MLSYAPIHGTTNHVFVTKDFLTFFEVKAILNSRLVASYAHLSLIGPNQQASNTTPYDPRQPDHLQWGRGMWVG